MAERPKTGMRAALWGFVEGLILCALVGAFFRLVRTGRTFEQEWPLLLTLSTGAGVVYAIGRGICGRITGAMLGGMAGVFLGAIWVGPALPQWTIATPVDDPSEKTIGQTFELAGPTLDGKRIDVADYRGKVVLVDFWATWCPPCVAEIPNVTAAYEKHHRDGFEVIAVSLDTSKEKLERFVQERKLPWPQIFFEEEDKRGGENPLARQYNVEGIPATFLLDQDGKVAATNLRGDEVEQEVARLLGKEAGERVGGIRQHVRLIPMTMYLSMAGCAVVVAVLGALAQRRWLPS
jgi:thiol-disulfide isomerase/thioredoxin